MKLRIMTNNVWGDYFGNEVEFRDRQLFEVYKKYSPDVIGFQEMTPGWYLSTIWEEMAPEYALVGNETPDTNNYTPLSYKTARFSALETGWKCLAETPDISKSITWAVLKGTDGLFALCSTHFWWVQGEEHDLIREKNAAELIALMRELEAKYSCPVFAVGDFNCSFGSAAFKKFEENRVTDLFDIAEERRDMISWHDNPVRGEDGRFHGTADTQNPYRHPYSFDHIIGIGNFKVVKHEIVSDQNALDATDHCPVYSDIEL